MGARRRKPLVHGVAAIAGALLVLGLPSTSAVAASRQPVSFSMVAGSPQVAVQERGPNHAVIQWSFGLTEFIDYSGPDGRFAVNPNLRMNGTGIRRQGADTSRARSAPSTGSIRSSGKENSAGG